MKRLIAKSLMFGNLAGRDQNVPPLPLVGRGWGRGAAP